MYKLINDAGETFNVDAPAFVRQNEDGFWIFCDEKDAQCISFGGKRYSIAGRQKIADAPAVMSYMTADAGAEFQNILRENIKNAQTFDEVKAAIIDCYDCIFDLYTKGEV